MRKTILTRFGLILFLASIGPPGAAADDASAPLAVSIQIPEAVYKIGDEIHVVFTVENRGAEAYKYWDRSYDRSGRMNEYELIAVDTQQNRVPDPWEDPPLRMGGGLMLKGVIDPGESFSKPIVLNRWALIKTPGTYRITGVYHSEGHGDIESEPVEIVIEPRTNKEMGAYIDELTKRFYDAEDPELCESLVKKLMYTCDARVAPVMLDALYDDRRNMDFWAAEAFNYYLPGEAAVTDMLYEAVAAEGLSFVALNMLEHRGVEAGKMRTIIAVTLTMHDAEKLMAAAYAARSYPDDSYTERLAELAKTPGIPARGAAIAAVAMNRTDEGVAALRSLLDDEALLSKDGTRTVGEAAKDAIQGAYRAAALGENTGRPLKPNDFPDLVPEPRQ